MTPRKLLVGIPCHDNRWHVNFAISMIKLANSGLFNLEILKLSGGGIAKARNSIASSYLRDHPEVDRMLWADSDIEFEPGMVDALWNRDLDIVGGLYAHKRPGPVKWSANPLPPPQSNPDHVTGLQKLAAIGTGFMMVKRKVYAAMIEANPEIEFVDDFEQGYGQKCWDLFPMGVVRDSAAHKDPTYLTEDWYFFHRARKLGFDVYADNTFFVKHWDGGTCYPLPEPPQKP